MKLILDIGVLAVTIQMMVAIGLELEPRHFRELAQRKGLLAASLAMHALTLPVIALVIARGLSLPPHLAAGLLLLGACPIGDIANFYTLLAQGNIALSVTLNTVSCLLSTITMAAVFSVYDRVLGAGFVFAVPTPTLAGRLALMVAVPVVAGMALRRIYPFRIERLATWLRNASLVGVGFLLVYVMLSQRQRLAADWQHTAAAAALFMTLAFLFGLGFAWILRLHRADRFTTAICFAVRNVALAMAIAVTILKQTEYAVFATVYFLTEVPLILAAIAIRRQAAKSSPAPVVAPGAAEAIR